MPDHAIAWSAVVVIHAAVIGARAPAVAGQCRACRHGVNVEFIQRRSPARASVSERLTARAVRNASASPNAESAVGQVANAATHAPDASKREETSSGKVRGSSRHARARPARAGHAIRAATRAGLAADAVTGIAPDALFASMGAAAEQASFRSPAMRAALGLFGGPPRRCSEVERRLRRIDCLPLHGRDADDEMLLRAVDERIAD